MTRASGAALGVLLACWAGLAGARAGDACEDVRARGTTLETLETLWDKQCLGGENDRDPAFAVLAGALRQAEAAGRSGAERLAYVRAIVIYERAALLEAAARMPLPGGSGPHPLALYAQRMETLRRELEAGATSAMLNGDAWDFLPSEREVGDGLGDYDLCRDLLRPACDASDGRADPALFRVAEDVLRHARLMDRLGDIAHRAELEDFTEQVLGLQEMWRQYAVEARSQTPLELYLNSRRFEARRAEHGFVRPPSEQIIALHPSVAMEYVGDAEEGNRFEPALMVEWIGINRWQWRGGASPAMAHPIGLSLISTYSDRAGTRDVGHGLVLHFRHVYSLGVTRHGGDTGVFVSVDLQKLLMDKKSKLLEVKEWFRVRH